MEVQSMTLVSADESSADRTARIAGLRRDYAAFVQYYFPHICTDSGTGGSIPCAGFHIAAANYLLKNRSCRAVFQWARGHAKSSHIGVMIPLWLKCQKERTINVMLCVSKSEDNARRLLGDLQAELQYNQRYIADYGVQYADGSWSEGEFTTADSGVPAACSTKIDADALLQVR
jgi:hypothetical protein